MQMDSDDTDVAFSDADIDTDDSDDTFTLDAEQDGSCDEGEKSSDYTPHGLARGHSRGHSASELYTTTRSQSRGQKKLDNSFRRVKNTITTTPLDGGSSSDISAVPSAPPTASLVKKSQRKPRRKHSTISEDDNDDAETALSQPTKGLSRSTLQRRATSRKFPCSACNRVFSRSDTLAVHAFSHLPYDERPFACELCDLRFCRQHDYLRHKDSRHLNARVHVCPNCSWGFSRSDALYRHSKWCGIDQTRGRVGKKRSKGSKSRKPAKSTT
ncbi:hypothetical protein HDU76_010275 [Blyttiomyces sp. JEL0837]|nr:hypothetical protein HDU76_010275 [Blyttiomyces sp. JEL0837]